MNRQSTALIIVVAIIILMAVIFSVLPLGIRSEVDHQRCRYRLLRLGQAVNYWVTDHANRSFPAVINPEPATAWKPGRQGSAESVLWKYLDGDVPKPYRENESEDEYIARLREQQFTVCPITGLPYWYNQDLRNLDPTRVASGMLDHIVYFHCQRAADGTWPHEENGVNGVYQTIGFGTQYQYSSADLADHEQLIADLEQNDPNNPELPRLRMERDELKPLVERGEVTVSLETEVTFSPRE